MCVCVLTDFPGIGSQHGLSPNYRAESDLKVLCRLVFPWDRKRMVGMGEALAGVKGSLRDSGAPGRKSLLELGGKKPCLCWVAYFPCKKHRPNRT